MDLWLGPFILKLKKLLIIQYVLETFKSPSSLSWTEVVAGVIS